MGIEAERIDGAITCRLTFRGEKLADLQKRVLRRAGPRSPLFPFRRAFGQVNALVYSAKKKAKSQLARRSGREGVAS